MVSVQKQERLFTPEEYLMIERVAPCKSEYVNGRIYAMSGASRKHNLIMLNTGSALHSLLRDGSCETYVSDMRVKVSETGLYTYPDVVIACGEPRFDDAQKDTLLNPMLLIEVLSRSTEADDRGYKFDHYKSLESLREYLLIAQDRIRIEQFVRQENGTWQPFVFDQREQTVPLNCIGAALSVAAVYARITFDDAASQERPASESA